MNYEEAMAYLQDRSDDGICLGLSRMRELCRRLGNPQDKLSFIHIAGTNGKGSTAAYISSILGVNGYLTGRFVSPVVFQYEECIQYEDLEGIHYIDRELLADLISQVAEAAEAMVLEGKERPTVFELETAVSFLAFVHWQCAVVVLEVGLGGREDATNVVENVLASVLTPIGKDHMHLLGDTLAEIAGEKAGIIREKGKVISFQKEKEAAEVIAKVCQNKKADLTVISAEEMQLVSMDLRGSVFSYQGEHYRTRMTGTYQMENACLGLAVCDCLKEYFPLDVEQRILGIREAYWRGRLEVVCEEPLILVDGAHNESGAEALAESIRRLMPGRCIHGIMGVFRDKDYKRMVAIMQSVLQDVVTVKAPGTRGLPAEELAQVWEESGCLTVGSAQSVQEALKSTLARCEKEDAVVLFGSLSLLRELKWRS